MLSLLLVFRRGILLRDLRCVQLLPHVIKLLQLVGVLLLQDVDRDTTLLAIVGQSLDLQSQLVELSRQGLVFLQSVSAKNCATME